MSHFLGWGAGIAQGGVGVGDGWGGGGVSMCMTRGHIFWCHTFWGGELAVGRVVWVLGMVGVEVSRCV